MTETQNKTGKLDIIRKEIDGLDEQIQELISERARLAFRVRESKDALKGAVDYFRRSGKPRFSGR